MLGQRWDWTVFAARLVVAAAVVGLLALLVPRWEPRSPVTRRRLRVRQVVAHFRATGRYEDGLDPAGWLPALEHRKRELAWTAVTAVLLGVVLAVLVVGAAVRTDPGAPGIWAMAAVVLGVFGTVARSAREESRAAGRLADLLRAWPDAPSGS